MQILNLAESNILLELLIEDMPFAIHDLIARSPRITEAAIVGTITKSLPSTIDFTEIQKWCVANIRWFVHNGDVANAGNRRYVMLPPYAILQKTGPDESIVKVCGDERAKRVVENEMKKINCSMSITKPGWHWGASDDQRSKSIGFRRTIIFPTSKHASVMSQLSTLGIPVITPKDFREKLPSIKNVCIPPVTYFSVRPSSWGSWYKYDSTILSHNRWKPIENIFLHDRGLYKWLPSEDFRGELSSRYFYHNNYENVAELTSSLARLWMYYLDFEEGNSRSIWISDRTVFVPLEIPEPHQHWLQLMSEDWRREENFRRYMVLENTREIAEVLSRTLHVKMGLGESTA